MTKNTGKKIKGNKDDVKHFIDFFDLDFFGNVDDEIAIDDATTQNISLI